MEIFSPFLVIIALLTVSLTGSSTKTLLRCYAIEMETCELEGRDELKIIPVRVVNVIKEYVTSDIKY